MGMENYVLVQAGDDVPALPSGLYLTQMVLIGQHETGGALAAEACNKRTSMRKCKESGSSCTTNVSGGSHDVDAVMTLRTMSFIRRKRQR